MREPMRYEAVQSDQLPLIHEPADWKTEWGGMPEFVQEKQEPFAALTIRFRRVEDLQMFAELIGQSLTRRTKSVWYPALDRTDLHRGKRYRCEP